jgi:hypothetical protein
VVDIFDAVGLDKPNIGLLDDEFLAQVRNLPERNLAVELLERLLEGEIKSQVRHQRGAAEEVLEMLTNVIARYQNRSIETAQVMEELVEMAKKFKAAASGARQLGLNDDEVRFYDALANNESAVRELADETWKIAHELTENLRKNVTVDWSQRESVRAKLRLMVKRICASTSTRPTSRMPRWSWCCSRWKPWASPGADGGCHTTAVKRSAFCSKQRPFHAGYPPKKMPDLPEPPAPRSVADVDGFVDLLRAACDEPSMARTLLALLDHPADRRGHVIERLVEHLRRQGAPARLVAAISCLADDAVAQQAQAVIRRGGA